MSILGCQDENFGRSLHYRKNTEEPNLQSLQLEKESPQSSKYYKCTLKKGEFLEFERALCKSHTMRRYGMRLLKVSDGKLLSQPGFVDLLKSKLREKITKIKLSRQQLYNADKTGLLWQLLPEKNERFVERKDCTRNENGKAADNLSWMCKYYSLV